VTTPGRTSRLRSSTAVTDPKRFVTPRTLIAGDPSGARSADARLAVLLVPITVLLPVVSVGSNARERGSAWRRPVG
jgi:hypothetical protein